MIDDKRSMDFPGARRAVLQTAPAGVLALSLTSPAMAGKPPINLGPQPAPPAAPVEFAAGDDLGHAGQGLVWQNERDGVRACAKW